MAIAIGKDECETHSQGALKGLDGEFIVRGC